jgi:DivIVA domain-containing protein
MPPLTPLDIQHKEFTKAMRGYAMHEVDTFLDQVTEEFTRMQDEIARHPSRSRCSRHPRHHRLPRPSRCLPRPAAAPAARRPSPGPW